MKLSCQQTPIKAYITIGWASEATFRDDFGDDFAHLAIVPDIEAADPGATLENSADFAAFEAANNTDGGINLFAPGGIPELVTNPYGVAVLGGGVFVNDAGANALLRTNRQGEDLTLAGVYDDVRLVPAPGFLGLPPELNPLPMQQVPTGLAVGPDRLLYATEFTGLPLPVGLARVLRFDPRGPADAAFEVFLEGFTNLTDLTFDGAGNLWVIEYDSDSVLTEETPFGALIRVAPDGERRVISNQLINPTGLTAGDDGTLYVANSGFIPGTGQILAFVPELPPLELALVDAGDDEILDVIVGDGAVIDVDALGVERFNLVLLNPRPGTKSVRFTLEGPVEAQRADRIEPYGVFAISGDRFIGRAAQGGDYTLQIQSFDGNFALGTPFDDVTIDFTFIKDEDED
ncbi:MAG: ScyD/ScyE family protein [Candidatus Competibacterales bacterium]